jgi:hypothetical protein
VTLSLSLDPIEVQARVNNGLEWIKTVGRQALNLDHRRIDIRKLRMDTGDSCAFTQSSDDAVSYFGLRGQLRDLKLIPDTSDRTWDQDHGFWVICDDYDSPDTGLRVPDRIALAEAYHLLTWIWVRTLRADAEWCAHHGVRVRPLVPVA